MANAKRKYLITGAGAGFGQALATAALSSGHSVIGTVRSEAARQEFNAMDPARARAILLDVTDFAAIGPAIARAERDAGPIDVLVNNAGYGHEGTLEESPLEEIRRQFDVNVFGAVAMMKAVLPFMRERRRGHIITSPRWRDMWGCQASPTTRAANSLSKASPMCWRKR